MILLLLIFLLIAPFFLLIFNYGSCTSDQCFCRRGTIEYHYVPGFNDDWFEINCERCEEKYDSFIDRCGDKWKVYLAE